MKDFVQLFQSQEPLIHKLHDKLEELTRGFLASFIKAEKLEGIYGKKLKLFDVTNEQVSLQISHRKSH